ncbi:MAG: hypothetical protein WEB00_03735 [Dehalococcoidia bacterium]
MVRIDRFFLWLAGALLLAALLAAACGGDDDDAGGGSESATSEEGGDDDGSAEGGGVGDAGFPTEYTAEGEPAVAATAQAGESGRRLLLRGDVTSEDGETVVSYIVRVREQPDADQEVECDGETFNGPLTSDVEEAEEDAGTATVGEGAVIDFTVTRTIGAFEDGDERVPICLEYQGTYIGAENAGLAGASGGFRLVFRNGTTTLTFD